MRGIISFDLDGTLADTSIRRNQLPVMTYEEQVVYGWVAYSKKCLSDTVVSEVAFLLRMAHQAGYETAVVSARAEEAADETREWLRRHGLVVDFMYLGNRKPEETHESYKVRRILELQEDANNFVQLHYDDWPAVRPALKEIGVPCLIVTPPYDHNGLCA